jgi:hypothetical protein
MPAVLDNPAHWISRAEEARSIADEMKDPESKKTMMQIAESYEHMARMAQRRLNRTVREQKCGLQH